MPLPVLRSRSAMTITSADGSMSAYLGEIGRIAILSKDQQLFHCKRIRRWLDWPDGKEAAPVSISRAGKRSMDRMVESNLRMVVSVAKKYAGQGVPIEDLIQEGNIGLLHACEKFDPERGYCFSTFSYWWIRQGMTRSLANASRLIRIPCNTSELARKLRRIQVEWLSLYGCNPSIEELAEAAGQPINRVKGAIEATTMQPRSLDQLVSDDKSPLGELIAYRPDESVDQVLERQLQFDQLREAMNGLPDLERLTMEGVVFNRLSHREVANQLQLSTTRVGQLQRSATQRLQSMFHAQQASFEPDSDTDKKNDRADAVMTVVLEESVQSSVHSTTAFYENVIVPA